MFSAFQKRVSNFFGRMHIEGGKASKYKAALTVSDLIGPIIFKAVGPYANGLTVNSNGTFNISSWYNSGFTSSMYSDINGVIYVNSINSASQIGGKYAFATNSSDAFRADTVKLALVSGRVIQGKSNKIAWSSTENWYDTEDLSLRRDAAGVLAQYTGSTPQESRIYATYTSETSYQRLSIKTIKEAVTATSGASVTTTISIPAYSHLIGVTTRVTTDIGTGNGTTGYQIGDGTDPDLWGAVTGTTTGTTSDAGNFTAIAALGPSAVARTITITAVGGNFDGTGVIEICAFYQRVEAD